MGKDLDHIHHVAIPVEDVATAVNYYTERFRVAVEYQDGTWALLGFANTKLALVTVGHHPAHFAVECNNLQDRASGRPIADHRDGSRSLYIHDPWHNVIELLETERMAGPR